MNKIFFCILHVSTCNLRWILSLFRPGMVEGVYDVKVTVDGVLIPIENMCQPRNPASDKCQFEVNCIKLKTCFFLRSPLLTCVNSR